MLKGLFHISDTPNLDILTPSLPAEDIINGESVWESRYAGFVTGKVGLPESSKCVCFAADLEADIAINPPRAGHGYIYIPKTTEVPRAIWQEVREELKDMLTTDFVSVKEYRFYMPVQVEAVGEVWVEGSKTRIDWYKSQSLPGNKFLMYHSTPMSNMLNIQKYGLIPRPAPHSTLWSPKDNVIYITSSIDIARDYAEQAYKMRKFRARAWIVFKIEYIEFPDEVFPDVDWGLPGTYYVKIPIPPENISLWGRVFIPKSIA